MTRTSPLQEAAFHAGRQAMAAALPHGADAAVAAVGACWTAAEELWSGLRATPSFALGTAPAACKRGCGWCCHQRVGAAAAEILHIAAAVRGTAAAERLTAWQPGRPCAFLENGACGIYALRPLKCRSLYNLDVRFCMKHYAGIEAPAMGPPPSPAHQAEPMDIFDGALHGLANALWAAGRDCPGVEFMPGLKAVIDRPDAARAWWAGEAVFPAEARLDWFPRPKGRRR